MKARRIALVIATAALVAAPTLVMAQGMFGGPGGGGHGWHRHHDGPGRLGLDFLLGRMAERLELSDEQRDQIEAIIDAGRPAIEALHDQMTQARRDFHDSHEPGAFDEAEATAFARSQSQLHAQIMVETMRLKSQVFAVLTPEQQQQLHQLRDEMGDRFRGRHGCRRGGDDD